MVFSLLPPRKFAIQTWFCNCPQYLCLFRIVVECSPSIHDLRKMLVLPKSTSLLSSAVRRVVHFCASLGTPRRWSLCLEGLYRKRRSAPLVRLCSPRDRALVCSGSSCYRFGLRAAVPPKLCLRVRTTLVPAAVPAAYGCVPRGQWALFRRRHVRIDWPVIMSGGACGCW